MEGKNSLLIGMTVLVAILGAGIYQMQKLPPPVAKPGGGGPLAPEVVTKTLDGERWSLRDQKGKVVLIDFWATWCGPCIAAMPHMKQVYNRFKSDPDFLMVGVSDDSEPDPVRAFVQREQIPWLQLFDVDKTFPRAFGIEAIPSVWVIDREGRIAGSSLAPNMIESTVAAQLARK